MSFQVSYGDGVFSCIVDRADELTSRQFQTAYYRLYTTVADDGHQVEDIIADEFTQDAWAGLAKRIGPAPVVIGLTNRSSGAQHTLRVELKR